MRNWRYFGIAIGIYAVCSGCSSNPQGVGTQAPEVTVVSPADESKSLSLSSLKGKVVLVDFWATWCGPCREEMPGLQKIYDDYKSKGLEMVAISQETAPRILEFQTQSMLSIPFYADVNGAANKAFHVTGLPTTLVLGKDGKIAFVSVGSGETVEGELRDAINKALG